MRLARALFIALSVCMGATALAGDTVGVNGSNVQYPVSKTATLGDKQFEQKLTGAGMRKKAIINVYTIGSYIDKEFTGKTPDDLACADCVKQLHLVLQRDVSGADMAHAFETAIRANYPKDFDSELGKLTSMIRTHDVAKGDQVWITNIPGYGLHINLVGKKQEFIPGVKFSKAVWDIYLGPKNVGEAVKKGLVSRLEQ
jgi:hypothetical protein